MATYDELVIKIRDWANRDDNVLSSANIKDFIQYTADEVYRELRIVPLESLTRYAAITPAQAAAGLNTLAIPADAIEFIQLRKVGGIINGDYTVYSAKTDIRSFYEEFTRNDYYRYTRERGNLVLNPAFDSDDVFELYYYRRLPDADARYSVNATNNGNDLLYYATSENQVIAMLQAAEGLNILDTDPDLVATEITSADTEDGLPIGFYIGRLTPNWLRDDNEKLLLFGSLMQAFDYLDEPEVSQKYMRKYDQEIRKLMDEENKRNLMGGNITMRFEAPLL